MKIVTIDWEKKLVEEYETDSIKYEEDGVSYTWWIDGKHKTIAKIPYNRLLAIKYD